MEPRLNEDRSLHASLGGNWTLEVSTGEIETPIAFDAELQDSWMFTLGTTEKEYKVSGVPPTAGVAIDVPLRIA